MENVTIFGIKNCDSIRKSQKLLQEKAIPFSFVDLRESLPDDSLLSFWCNHFGESFINKRSRTFQENKSQFDQDLALDQDTVLNWVKNYPAIIKRPIVNIHGHWLQGLPALKQYLNEHH